MRNICLFKISPPEIGGVPRRRRGEVVCLYCMEHGAWSKGE
jgi:hypothetical protein